MSVSVLVSFSWSHEWIFSYFLCSIFLLIIGYHGFSFVTHTCFLLVHYFVYVLSAHCLVLLAHCCEWFCFFGLSSCLIMILFLYIKALQLDPPTWRWRHEAHCFFSDLPVACITSGTPSNQSYFVKPPTNQSTISLSKICQQCRMNSTTTVKEENNWGHFFLHLSHMTRVTL